MITTRFMAIKEDFEKREKERKFSISSLLSGEKIFLETELKERTGSNDYNHVSFYSDIIYFVSQIDIKRECHADWKEIDECATVADINKGKHFRKITDYGRNILTNFFNLIKILNNRNKKEETFRVIQECAEENPYIINTYFILFPEEEQRINEMCHCYLPISEKQF